MDDHEETRRRRYIGCPDMFCGADDCPTCRPENFRERPTMGECKTEDECQTPTWCKRSGKCENAKISFASALMIEDLTENEATSLDAGKCPDCGSVRFLEGPQGGCSVNIMCAGCGSKFNVVPGLAGAFGKERIGRPERMTDNTSSPVLGTGFYRDAKPGTFGRSEWLDLLMACQDGRATYMRALEIIEREMDLLRNPPKHVYWGAGEPDCPKDIKAPNGELHTMKCKVCGLEDPRDNACRASLPNK